MTKTVPDSLNGCSKWDICGNFKKKLLTWLHFWVIIP